MTPPARARRILAESFYERFFYNDLFGSEDDPQLSSANLMAMLVFPGILCLYLIPKYYVTLRLAPESVRELEVLGDRYVWFAYSMSVMGLLTALQWERLFPDERDYFVIGPQPTPTRALFEAQAIALARFLGLFAVVIHIGSALFFPIGVTPFAAGLLEGLQFALAHWLSLALSSLFVVSAVAGLQGLLLAALPARVFRRISGIVQLAAALSFCGLIVLLPALRAAVFSGARSVADLASGPAAWLPPMWFAALGHWLAAPAGSPLGGVALRAAWITAATVLFAAAGYWVGYRRFLGRSLESPDVKRRGAPRSRSNLAARLLGRSGAARAAAAFSLKTLARSPRQRMEFGAWLAIGLALVVAQGWSMTAETFAAQDRSILAQPFLLLLVGLAGLRRAYDLPAELPAHWAFRLYATRDPSLYHEGSRRATFAAAVLPLLALSTALVCGLWGCGAAWTHFVLFALAGVASVEAARLGARKIPFTCSYAAARAHAVIVWTLSAVGILLAASLLGGFERDVLENPWLLLPAASITAGLVVLRTALESDSNRERELVFEESADAFPNRLKLL